ncbi:MAG TPA: tRNA pseudouridine(54/55) synthase Pus10 [Pyrodictium delaneyi]|uniref:tRNA pseudouridine synthase Pus10 n=1 Tax=Pyrodictium delaneyi TaxID=1273541 RepID=A0A832ZT42_9CREN|nr:tRNA pseudouridine(54/55) synthase Pus10 [Pyrodictium delaneyi]
MMSGASGDAGTQKTGTIASETARIIERAYAVLREYPLCSYCLGRMFALLGRGWSNAERGDALKCLIVMGLHAGIREGSDASRAELEKLAPNIGSIVEKLYSEIYGRTVSHKECYLCGSRLPGLFDEAARRAAEMLSQMDISNFLVAARLDPGLREREDELKRRFGLVYAESIAAEVKREVSKRLQKLTGLQPEFDNPDVVVEIGVPQGSVNVHVMPLLLRGRYWKIARRVSQSAWITRYGERRYPFSVEDALFILAEVADADDAILHGSGREDADARMLGLGRPFIVELKRARRRRFSLEFLEATVNRYAAGLVEVKLGSRAYRRDVSEVKGEHSKKSKIYKALVVVSRKVSDEELRGLEQFFTGASIRQRTPRRVRHRRPDVVRERVVFSVKTRRIGASVFEAVVVAEGGLYIKELVSGDEGDTSPSFAEYLGAEAYCVELDVLGVLEPMPPGP